jgi:hypothetical protein
MHGRTLGVTLLAVGPLSWIGARRSGPRSFAWVRGDAPTRPSTQTMGIVRVKTPWYAPSFVVRARIRGAVPEYEAMTALDEKYYVLTEDGRFGGVYLWRSRADAQAYYSDAWRAGVRARRGTDPELDLFEVTTVVEGTTRVVGAPEGARSLSYPAFATLILWRREGAAEPTALAAAAVELEGALRSFVVRDDTRVGLVTVWATRAHAEAGPRHARVVAFGPPAVHARFEAPVLMDASLRAASTAAPPP